ncbi:MAG: Cna B-type domain-containing protein, partial [Clostridiales bacterium]|nr:Cna B-type domain-containing protein [Clostridiales bacterium]
WAAYTFTNLPKYGDDQKLIEYTITEDAVPGYTTSREGNAFTNTLAPGETSVPVAKAWADDGNADNTRPTSITFRLLADNVEVRSYTMSAPWNAYTFSGLPKYGDDQKLIAYTITEDAVPGYTTAMQGSTFTNTLAPGETSVPVAKVWTDNNNSDNTRPASITFRLLADNVEVRSYTMSAPWNAYTFSGLPKYDGNQKLIEYTVTEDAVPGYTSAKSETGNTFTNTLAPGETSVPVAKAWVDDGNADSTRPASITFRLLADNVEVSTYTMTAPWAAYTFSGLPKYDGNQKLIEYTVTEDAVPGYTSAKSETGNTFTNTLAPGETSVPVSKAWVDDGNADNTRPASITFRLLADDVEVSTYTMTAPWAAYTFSGLPKYGTGQKLIAYTVTEDAVPGYTTTKQGNTFTNTLDPGETSVPVAKVWTDDGNADNTRPASITFRLLADNIEVGTYTMTAPWAAYTFSGLPKYGTGQKLIAYTVTEDAVPGYTTTKQGNTFTNTLAPGETSVPVAKVWTDNNNSDNTRPASITFRLLADNVEVSTYTMAAPWNAYTFNGLPKYDENQKLIEYTVTEDAVPGYTTVMQGSTFTNTLAPGETSVPVAKVWTDNNNSDDTRPASITFRLLADNVEVSTYTMTAPWNAYTFSGLPKYDGNQKLIAYTVTEDAVPGYTTTMQGNAFTNTLAPGETSVPVAKAWVDDGNADNTRPASITFRLLADNVEVGTYTMAAPWNAYTFSGLPKYGDDQKLIAYTVTEDAVPGYTSAKSAVGNTFTNTLAPGETSVPVAKAWVDNGNADSTRPTSITFRLLADDVVVDTYTMTAPWAAYTFSGLPKYSAADQKLIAYTVTEDAIPGYTSTKSETGNTFTNTLAPGETSVPVAKAWTDNNNADNTRPASITFRLMADNVEVDTYTMAAPWNAYTFTGLPKYDGNQKLIAYTVTEDAVPGYTTTMQGSTFTNTLAPGETSVPVAKAWVDDGNADNTRPVSITFRLLADNIEVGEYTMTVPWADYTFSGLPKYDGNQKLIAYTVTEDAVPGYTTSREGNAFTNTLDPGETSVPVSKVWVDDSNADSTRPESITFRLMADNIEVATYTMTAPWEAYTFAGLPKYSAANQKLIEYTVTEDAVASYTSAKSETGNTFTNTLSPGETSVPVSKVWVDDNNADNTRPQSVTFNLLADGVKVGEHVMTAPWNAYTFEGLPKYDGNQKLIAYTVTEDAVPGYTSAKSETGNTFTNTLAPGETSVPVSKVWVDDGNADNTRPAGITFRLLADNVEVSTYTMTAPWADYTFTGLPKYDGNQKLIAYTVTEDAVPGYTSAKSETGNTFTNTLAPGETSVPVAKVWVDDGNADNTRPASITFRLLADNIEVSTYTMTAPWNAYTFTGLPKYSDADQKLIAYTVTEDAVTGYTSAKSETGNTFTNTLDPGETSVPVSKTWVDDTNGDNTRPLSITFNLLRNGQPYDTYEMEAPWEDFSFGPLDKYDGDQKLIEYTVTEDAVAGYTTDRDGNAFTNTLDQVEISVPVRKVWVDDGNADNTRPEIITFNLLRNGQPHDTYEMEAPWEDFNFGPLDKYDDSQKFITYSVTEDAVAGYTTSREGSTFTNTLAPGETSVSVNKVWDDEGDEDGVRPYSITFRLWQNGIELEEYVMEAPTLSYTFDGLTKYDEDQKPYVYAVTEDPVAGYTTDVAVNGNNYTFTNTRSTGPDEGTLTVNKVLLDVNGLIIDEGHPDFEKHQDVEFTIQLADSTNPEIGTAITRQNVSNMGSVSFFVSDTKRASELELSEINIPEGYELEEIIQPIHWSNGNGVTTVVNRVQGEPTVVEPGSVRVVKYIVYQGELINTSNVNRVFDVSISTQENAFGTVVVDVQAIEEGIEEFYDNSTNTGEGEFVEGNVVAVLYSEGTKIYEEVSDGSDIEFSGLQQGKPYDVKIMLRDLELEEDITIFEDTIEFTSHLTYRVGFAESRGMPEPEAGTATLNDGEELPDDASLNDGDDDADGNYGDGDGNSTSDSTSDGTLGDDDENEGIVGDGDESGDAAGSDGDSALGSDSEVADSDGEDTDSVDSASDEAVNADSGDENVTSDESSDEPKARFAWFAVSKVYAATYIPNEELIEFMMANISSAYTNEVGSIGAAERFSGKVTANDPNGLFIDNLRQGMYVVTETGIPTNFKFYGMKLGNTDLSMSGLGPINGISVEVGISGAVVVIFNEYVPPTPPTPPSPPRPRPGPGPEPGPGPIDIPDNPPPLDEPPVEGGDGPVVDLPDVDVPLDDLPKTGLGSMAWLFGLMFISGLGIVFGRRRDEE